MIAIIGTTEDDISYIAHKTTNARTEIVATLPVTIGVLGGRDVVVGYSGRGQALASLFTGLIIDKYDPYLIINVGNVSSIDDKLPQGSLFMCDRIYNIDVDLTAIGRYKVCQTPGFSPYFTSSSELINRMRDINARYNNEPLKVGTLLSSNKFFTRREDIEKIIADNFLGNPNILAVDTESAGVAMTCALYDMAYFAIKVVSNEVGRPGQLITRVRAGLVKTPVVGQYIVAMFYQIDENE